MKAVTKYAKDFILNEDEKFKLAFAEAYFSPEKYFFPQYGGEILKVPTLGYDVTESYGLSKHLVVRVGDFDFGWVENILVEPKHDRAVIGHFAVSQKLVGLGFGKRMAKGLGEFLKTHHSVNNILFVEQHTNAMYDYFFESTLHATQAPFGANIGWLWKIS